MLSSVLESLLPTELAALAARNGLAAVTAFAFALWIGRWFIRYQNRRGVLERTERGDSLRLDELHRAKGRTPTMGGFIFITAMTVSSLLWARLDGRAIWILLATTLALGALGFADDYVKLAGIRRQGLAGRAKLATQLAVGGAVGVYLYLDPLVDDPAAATAVVLPVLKAAIPLGVLYVLAVGFVTAGCSNAVNLTDGLDGLAIGCSILAGVPFAVISVVTGDAGLSERFGSVHVPGSSEVAIFASSLVGGGLGFLWFNRHPAKIFMGDTGALALGGAFGVMAVITKKEFFFLLAGGVFVVEMISVVLQVASFKLRGKRIFLIAPLHHHYQFKGWEETEVTRGFWMAGAILATLALVTLRIW